jgi:hypothetical protein
VLDVDTVSRLERFNYTDSCVLTDLQLRVDSIGAWHPTFVNLFDPAKRKSLTALTKHNKECQTATVYGLTDDRQRLRCDGARHHNACGQRSLPDWQSSTKHDVYRQGGELRPGGRRRLEMLAGGPRHHVGARRPGASQLHVRRVVLSRLLEDGRLRPAERWVASSSFRLYRRKLISAK